MSFFGRSNNPNSSSQGLPSQPYQRVPQPPQQRVPAPRYEDPRGYEVVSAPSEQLAMTNALITHPSDFQAGSMLWYVTHHRPPDTPLTPNRHDNTGKILPGQVGAGAVQRQWMGLSAQGDTVSVEPVPYIPSYLQSIDISVDFLRRGHEIAEAFSADDMAKLFVRAFNGMIWNVGQLLFRLQVTGLSVVDLPNAPSGGRSPDNVGVVMEKTDVNFLKAANSAIKIKSSAKKAPSNAIIAPNFKFEDMGIGGLDSEFSTIFRRAFASRVFPPGLVEKLETGILLFGPPGTGKTLMARQIGKMLNAREPKIVNGPEILNKYVDAEKEVRDESGLHIIIFDELDAICKQRGSTNSGTGVGDSVVNQLLSKMDGVDQLNNISSSALLRPGRLEVHMEISLPDEKGMRENGIMDSDVDLLELAQLTKNFSGARSTVGTMAGVSDDIEDLRVNRQDFLDALNEVTPAFGVAKEELEMVIQNGIIHYDPLSTKFYALVNYSSCSLLLHGPPGSGKTALAATIARSSDYPFMKLVSPDDMVGFSESQKVAAISKTFADSYKSPLSVIVVDSIERLLDFTAIGPRFSNSVLQTLMVLFAKRPPKGRRLLVIATTSLRPILTDLGLSESFDAEIRVPPLSSLTALEHVINEVDLIPNPRELQRTMEMLEQAGFGGQDGNGLNIGIKKLLSVIEMARQEPEAVGERLVTSLMGL
ncbi:P-loop containing nucleoside triphosphate hydrolase protein [Irpex lacteus]|nr:P-loop containing nucleoside triphosphate hydrolase protein [Irpex lacteus]